MRFQSPSIFIVCLGSLAGLSNAFWRMSCGIIQTGRIDPIVSPGKVASHVHKIAGASSIGLDSTYESLQASSCTSCEIGADKSAYWTPQLYYEHTNGSFEEVPNNGMTVYYEGRGDNRANIRPFPAGFRMLSGDPTARSYNTSATLYQNTRPIADRVSFACLAANPSKESPHMNVTDCSNGLRAQVQFQSCWDGVNLYKEDNSHVAYMSGLDNGLCPPTHPVQLIHLFYEVLYSVNDIKHDGGQFVFAHGDPTGYGFHGDFLNGWDNTVLTSAIAQCANTNDGTIANCPPLAKSDNEKFADTCPAQKPLTDEPTRGMIGKLPGCINITPGPAAASIGDMVCGAGVAQPAVNAGVGALNLTAAATGAGSHRRWSIRGF